MGLLSSVLPSLIPAVGQIAGGLLSKSPKGPSLQSIRKQALRAGFNPLTVLRNGGGVAAFSGQAYPPQLSSAGVIASALGNAAAEYFREEDPTEKETRQLENDLLREQIAAARRAAVPVQVSPIGPPPFPARPAVAVVPTSPKRVAKPDNVGLGVRVEASPDVVVQADEPTLARLGPNAVSVPSAEEAYGDVGNIVAGIWNAGDKAVQMWKDLAPTKSPEYRAFREKEKAKADDLRARRQRREAELVKKYRRDLASGNIYDKDYARAWLREYENRRKNP